jgi:parallel beta-helix repeat protein
LYLDYMIAKNGRVDLAFPVVGGWGVRGASVEGLTIEGNAGRRANVDGCRAGGIYLFECRDVTIRDCVVRDYNGDGISFQVSENVTVEGCTVEGNTGLGLHPGSGSQRPVLRKNRSLNNGGDGLYVCWRVKHGLFEGNELVGNSGSGISIGHKDTDNTFRGNTIIENKRSGVLFREESEPMGAHRNVFEDNRIVDNGDPAKGRPVSVEIRGHHHGLVFRRNVFGWTEADAPGDPVGVVRGANATGLRLEDNRFLNVASEID